MTLTEFLLARIAEDEANARDAGADAMTGHRWKHAPEDVYGELQATVLANSRRVLAECEAKRVMIELRYSWNLQAERMTEPPFGPILQTQVNTADAIIRRFAAVYADHPDYDEAWRS